MTPFSRKLNRPFNPNNPKSLSASLRNFRSKISSSIAGIGSELDPRPEKWFDLINATSAAFTQMAVELNHPMTRWGERLTDDYLNHTLNILNLLNSVTASLSQRKYRVVDLKPDRSTRIVAIPDSDTEIVLLEALGLYRGVETLSIGFLLSELCGESEPYMDIRKCVRGGGFGDVSVIVKDLDSRFCKEVIYFEILQRGESTVEDLTRNSIEGLEKQSSNMFYLVLATRNKLIDNHRITLH